MNSNTLYIVDDDSHTIDKNEMVVFLNQDNDKFPNKLPLLEEFSKTQSKLRDELLEFNESILNKLRKYLDKDEDYRYLLSSTVFEKSPYKTNYVYNFFKSSLIVKYIKEYSINNIVISSVNNEIIKFFQNYSLENKIICRVNNQQDKFHIKQYITNNSFLSSLYILKREYKKIKLNIQKNKKKNENLVVSYFPNYSFDDNNQFYSNYFAEISQSLNKNFDWLFIYVNDINNLKNEEKVLVSKNFNQYEFLDAYISINDLLEVRTKLNNILKKFNQIDLSDLFVFKNTNYYELLIKDWKKFIGFELFDTLIFEKKFKNFFNDREYINVLYLLEYQPWEQMLNKTLQNKATTTKSITHSVFRPNLMNYYYTKTIHDYMYTSNIVAANSDFSKKMLLENGYLEDSVKEIEAQRFNYLANIAKELPPEKNLLIITSIDFNETSTLLRLFSEAIADNNIFDNIFIKPHPFTPIDSIIQDLNNFPEFIILNGKMSDALQKASTVFVASSSSSLLESILYGKKTITLFSLDTLPMPSIDNHELLNIVTSSKQLKKILDEENDYVNMKENDESLLYLNDGYTKWKKILEEKS